MCTSILRVTWYVTCVTCYQRLHGGGGGVSGGLGGGGGGEFPNCYLKNRSLTLCGDFFVDSLFPERRKLYFLSYLFTSGRTNTNLDHTFKNHRSKGGGGGGGHQNHKKKESK